MAFHGRTTGLTTQTGTGLADFGAQAKWHKSFPVIRNKENSPGLQQPGSFFTLPHHYKGNFVTLVTLSHRSDKKS